MILKMMLIVVGIFLLILDLFMYARQKLTDGSKKCGTVCICCVCCYNPVFI